jgi:signal transduction histidine kinase
MPENHAYSVNKSFSSQQGRQQPFAVVVIAGLGLGLYIAADIVRRHGGSIIVNSEKGKGSVFTVMLPIGKGRG